MFGTYRLILACFVALSHFGFVIGGFNPGQWAVLSFYVLSGFLMENQFHKLSGGGEIRLFFIDRFLRIYPLFIVVLLLTTWLLRPSLSVFVTNSLLFPLNYSIFTGIPYIIGSSWSLALEAHFYLLVPFLACASTPFVRTVALSSVGIFMSSPFLPYSGYWAYGVLPGILFAFLTGILIKRKDMLFLRFLWLLFTVLLVAFAYSKFNHMGLPTGLHINVCIGYITALPLVVWLASLSQKVCWDQRLGLLSYPLFLVHGPVSQFALSYFGQLPMYILLLLAILAAGLLVLLVEIPFDKIRYKMRKKTGQPAE